MKGDLFCSHCATTLRWVDESEKSTSCRSLETREFDLPMQLFNSCLGVLHEQQHILAGLKDSFDVSKASDETTFSIHLDFPGGDIHISFKRQNKYFTTTDYIRYSCVMYKIDGNNFLNDFSNLKNAQWLRDAVRRKESETCLEFYDCGGGYEARWDGSRTNTFELKQGCEVIAHFIENESSYKGYIVDFTNHRLENELKRYDRAIPYDWVKDFKSIENLFLKSLETSYIY